MTAVSRTPEHETYAFLARLEREAASQGSLRSEEAYKGARVDRLNKGWQPEHRSGDAAISESHELLTSRKRDAVRNNPIIAGAKRTLADLIVGSGVQTFFAPPLTADAADAEDYFDYALESDEKFDDWATSWADAEGRLSWYDMQRMMIDEVIETGDSLALECYRDDKGRKIPLCFQLIEREQLDFTKDRPGGPKQNKIVHGIEWDRSNRPVAYHIFDAHPYDTYTGGLNFRSTRILAHRVRHLYWPSRPSAHVGVSWFHSLTQDAHDRDWYANAELTAAAIAAQFVAVINRANPGGGDIGLSDGEDLEELNDPVRLGPGLIFEGGEKDDVKIIESKRPSGFAAEFMEFIDHNLAMGAGLSYCRLTGRYKATSYTAARAAHLDDESRVAPVKNWFATAMLLPVRKQFNRLAIGLGQLKTVSANTFRRNEEELQRFEAIGPGREQLDPEAETEASISKLRAGLSTLRHECGLRGKHWVRVLRQMKIEKDLAGRLGLTLDYSKGQGSRAEKTTTDASPADAA